MVMFLLRLLSLLLNFAIGRSLRISLLPNLLAQVLFAFLDGDLAVVAMEQSSEKDLQGQAARLQLQRDACAGAHHDQVLVP